MKDVTKEYFTGLLKDIESKAIEYFPSFETEIFECRVDEGEEGQLYYCDSRVRFKTKEKYINFWFVLTKSENKVFSAKVAFGNNKIEDSGFALTDYLAHRNIDFDRSLLFKWLTNYEDCVKHSEKLFEAIIDLIKTEELHEYLYSDFDISVPIDYSPYK